MNPYQVLGLPYPSPLKDVKSAYRKLAFKYHPDTSKELDAEKRFIRIQKAYELIMKGWRPPVTQDIDFGFRVVVNVSFWSTNIYADTTGTATDNYI